MRHSTQYTVRESALCGKFRRVKRSLEADFYLFQAAMSSAPSALIFPRTVTFNRRFFCSNSRSAWGNGLIFPLTHLCHLLAAKSPNLASNNLRNTPNTGPKQNGKHVKKPRNFGTKQRDFMRAAGVLLNSSREAGERGFSTVATTLKRLEKFRAFAKGVGINRLDKIEPKHVRAYAAELKKSDLSASYQQNLLSAVNSVMKLGHERLGSSWETVSSRAEGLPARDNVRTEPTSTREHLRQALSSMPERAAAVAILARDLGLRSKEASLLNCKKALHQAQASGLLRIESGTKGGRAREIPITSPEQIQSLAAAAHLQGNCRNLIPEGETWAGFRAGTLLKGRDSLKKQGIAAYHDLRAAYAADRYQELTGHPAPCNAGAHRAADRTADQAARMLISKELGHGRTDVLVSYVGSSR